VDVDLRRDAGADEHESAADDRRAERLRQQALPDDVAVRGVERGASSVPGSPDQGGRRSSSRIGMQPSGAESFEAAEVASAEAP